MSPIDPYAALGLAGNPFVATAEAGAAAGEWIDRGLALPPVGDRLLLQIMGEMGAGKTTHLLHCQGQIGGIYCCYPAGLGRWRVPPVAPIAFWDEADRIPRSLLALALWRAVHLPATIVAGTHADLSGTALQVGLRVQTIYLPKLEVETLLLWATQRIAAARLPDKTVHLSLTPAEAAQIVELAGASWRKAAVHLHVWAAKQVSQL
jgi:hypothetical protein